MAFEQMREYYYEFTLDGDTHVGKATGPAGMMEDHRKPGNPEIDGMEFTRQQLESHHPRKKVTVIRPLKSHEELAKRAAELSLDPNHVPMTGEDLKAERVAETLNPTAG